MGIAKINHGTEFKKLVFDRTKGEKFGQGTLIKIKKS